MQILQDGTRDTQPILCCHESRRSAYGEAKLCNGAFCFQCPRRIRPGGVRPAMQPNKCTMDYRWKISSISPSATVMQTSLRCRHRGLPTAWRGATGPPASGNAMTSVGLSDYLTRAWAECGQDYRLQLNQRQSFPRRPCHCPCEGRFLGFVGLEFLDKTCISTVTKPIRGGESARRDQVGCKVGRRYCWAKRSENVARKPCCVRILHESQRVRIVRICQKLIDLRNITYFGVDSLFRWNASSWYFILIRIVIVTRFYINTRFVIILYIRFHLNLCLILSIF